MPEKTVGTGGLRCPCCGVISDSACKDTRPSDGLIRRRRVCSTCLGRYTTFEVPETSLDRLMALARMSTSIRDTLKKALEEIPEVENV